VESKNLFDLNIWKTFIIPLLEFLSLSEIFARKRIWNKVTFPSEIGEANFASLFIYLFLTNGFISNWSPFKKKLQNIT
jgi:hypothetical protein